MLKWMLFIVRHLFVHFRISFSLSFQRKSNRHVFLLLFVLTPVHLNWPSYATGKCYRSPRQLISTMKHRWLYITIHSLTIFKWKMRNLRLHLIYLSFFVQYTYLCGLEIVVAVWDISGINTCCWPFQLGVSMWMPTAKEVEQTSWCGRPLPLLSVSIHCTVFCSTLYICIKAILLISRGYF